MPSAASVKVDKPPTTNILANNAVAANKEAAALSENVDNSSPVRQISLIIEHKIRNLEKRKVSPKHLNHEKKTISKSKQHFCVTHTPKKRIKKNTKRVKDERIRFLFVFHVRMHVFFIVVCVAHIMDLCDWWISAFRMFGRLRYF